MIVWSKVSGTKSTTFEANVAVTVRRRVSPILFIVNGGGGGIQERGFVLCVIVVQVHGGF